MINRVLEKAVIAGGCFWGVEHLFKNTPGVYHTRVGYTGGEKNHPGYEEVCEGHTGHVEAVEISYDPAYVNYEDILKLFFEIHDFTQENGQGPDIGTQYHSVIFYENHLEKEIAQKLINILETKGYKVATRLQKAGIFWEAEPYHQNYYTVTGKTPYCHFRKKIFWNSPNVEASYN